MRVRCKYRYIDDVLAKELGLNDKASRSSGANVGDEFIVLGISYSLNYERSSNYPLIQIYSGAAVFFTELYMFDIIDNTPSKYWRIKFNEEFKELSLEPELLSQKYFHDHFSDQYPEEEKAFFELYNLMIEEDEAKIRHPEYKYAESIGDNWVLCPECNEAFEVDSNSVVIKCPNIACKIKLNNPYAKEFPKIL